MWVAIFPNNSGKRDDQSQSTEDISDTFLGEERDCFESGNGGGSPELMQLWLAFNLGIQWHGCLSCFGYTLSRVSHSYVRQRAFLNKTLICIVFAFRRENGVHFYLLIIIGSKKMLLIIRISKSK